MVGDRIFSMCAGTRSESASISAAPWNTQQNPETFFSYAEILSSRGPVVGDEILLFVTCIMYPSSVTICDLFAQTVRNYPDNLAVDHEQACLTYRELDNASTSLARKLQSLGITVASPIVLVTSHGSFNIIAILAILKSGSYFVPIDWDSWPAERIDQVLDTVQSPLVINTTAEPFSPGRSSCQVLNIDSLPYSNTMESNLEATKLGPHDTACVMFTSGSTGKPKGVMLSHKSLCLYSQTTPMNMNISPGDRVLHILSVAFDGERIIKKI